MKFSYNHFQKYAMVSICVLSFASLGASAQGSSLGGLFAEPAVTYELGDSSVDYPAPFSNSSGDINGFGLGVRLGVHLNEVIFLGGDVRYSMPKFKDSTNDYDASAVSTNWGVVVGVQMPDIGLRIWGTYVLGGEIDPEKSNNVDVKFAKATGYRVGGGFRVAMISLNLEYQDLNYDKATLQELGAFTPGSSFDDVELKNKSWIASVSFPLEL